MDWRTLNEAMTPNQTPDETLQAYLPHFEAAMVAANINTVRRAAAWCSQLGHESAGLKYMAEIQTNGAGWSEDRRIYRGRGPIQLTWRGNYLKFGQWCHEQGYVDDPEIFVETPTLVEQPRWGFLAASWYWLNAGPRPGKINSYADAGDIVAVSRCINGWFPDRLPNGMADRQARWDRCLQLGQRLLPNTTPPTEEVDPMKPEFNEYPIWSPCNSARGSTKVDLFLLHTQEGGGGDNAADGLARWMSNPANQVSYHYTISQASDGGVTVVDCVDTDRYSWSVLSANPRSINLCFAGSRAGWTREQWLKQSKAIDVAAYLAVQDCKKYHVDIRVLKPPYGTNPPGISDHKYVTQQLKDGDHTDVGNNFPWDVFEAAIIKYAKADTPVPVPTPTPTPPGFQYPPTEEMIKQIWEQLFGVKGKGWPNHFGKVADGSRGKFTVEAISDLHKDAQ